MELEIELGKLPAGTIIERHPNIDYDDFELRLGDHIVRFRITMADYIDVESWKKKWASAVNDFNGLSR